MNARRESYSLLGEHTNKEATLPIFLKGINDHMQPVAKSVDEQTLTLHVPLLPTIRLLHIILLINGLTLRIQHFLNSSAFVSQT